MRVISSALLILIMSFATVCSIGQVNDQKIRQQVLKKSIKDSLFVFGKWTKHGGSETHLKYLGQVTTRKGRRFKVVISNWFWGLSHRATSRILIFNQKNQYIGEYYMTMTYDLPTKLENGNLIFKNTDDDCDKELIAVVNLKSGLPKHFFKKCKGEFGNIYSFGSD
jgi:hypothetical protein